MTNKQIADKARAFINQPDIKKQLDIATRMWLEQYVVTLLKEVQVPKMKVSPKQKEVILQMRAGAEMFKHVTHVALRHGGDCPVHTFFSLVDAKLIKPKGKAKFKAGVGKEYILTELGKTIVL